MPCWKTNGTRDLWEGSERMNYVLKGRIAMGGGMVSLDKTLTIEGMAADAKAAGDAIRAKADAAEVIKEIERVETEFHTIIEQIPGSPDNNNLAQEALDAARAALVIAQNTQTLLDNSLSGLVKTVNGIAPDEFGNVTLPSADEVSY